MAKKNRSSVGLRGKQRMSGPAEDATRYNGPVKVHNNRADTVIITVGGPQQVTITTNASGNGTFAATLNSSDVFTNGDFAAMALLYEEYRVLGVRGEYYPKLRFADGSAIGGGTGTESVSPFLMAPWREEPANDVTLNQAMLRGGSKAVSVNDYIQKEVKADEVDLMEWQGVNAAIGVSSQYGIHTFVTVTGAPASTVVQYGHLFAFYTLQFRTRRIGVYSASSAAAASLEVKEEYVRVEAGRPATPQQRVELPRVSQQAAVPFAGPPQQTLASRFSFTGR
jgi:hypothetical protein